MCERHRSGATFRPFAPRNPDLRFQVNRHRNCHRNSVTVIHRVDAVAGAVAHIKRATMTDVDQTAKAMKDTEMEAEIEDFLEGFNQPTYRGMRVDGVRVGLPSSDIAITFWLKG
jgi:hypothetical protein